MKHLQPNNQVQRAPWIPQFNPVLQIFSSIVPNPNARTSCFTGAFLTIVRRKKMMYANKMPAVSPYTFWNSPQNRVTDPGCKNLMAPRRK